MSNNFGTKSKLDTPHGSYTIFKPALLEKSGQLKSLERMPYSIRILLEGALRNQDGFSVTESDVIGLAAWQPGSIVAGEIGFKPGRVILQDFTGVPAVVDLAALRSAMLRLGGDPMRINPRVQVDLVIDHSVQVDRAGDAASLETNIDREFERNGERYEFLKWGQESFENFDIIPPGTGIVHQVNLEYLASLVLEKDGVLYPDTLVGTDSHTTMINGLGVLGWGVGGIEAEAVMLGQPLYMLIPEVVGLRLKGRLAPGITATDAVLRATELLRGKGVVGKFVEFCGEGLDGLSLPDRATLANMAPEYGATMGFCPPDEETLQYMRDTGRNEKTTDLAERYLKEQGFFRTNSSPEPEFSDLYELDLSEIKPALSGPKRPQDRIPLGDMQKSFALSLTKAPAEGGLGVKPEETEQSISLAAPYTEDLKHGSVVIAAITSCTNTSNPDVMLGAGILAKKARAKGLQVKPYVKTSLAPGSRVVSDYLDQAGVTPYLEELGFYSVGYGCTTCIGNSGPLATEVVDAIDKGSLVATSVLSGNRNFEGRISPHVRANYLASPPLVIAFAIAGRADIDLESEALGQDQNGTDVYLRDIWPLPEEIEAARKAARDPKLYRRRYGSDLNENKRWNAISVTKGQTYNWNEKSTYIQEPGFFKDMPAEPPALQSIRGARVLAKLGDSVTTDHISPAGSIAADQPAGKYLIERGITQSEFNSYGSRRGNDLVMTRGTFANIRLRNQLAPGTEGGWTKHIPSGEQLSIYDAAQKYAAEGTPLIVLAGTEYGTGSSRDWAAKGTFLLGVRAVIAASYERIHRSNLVGMGVLPLQFLPGDSHESLGLNGTEEFAINGIDDSLKPGQKLKVTADDIEFEVLCRMDTAVEIEYYRNGGILHAVLRNFLKE